MLRWILILTLFLPAPGMAHKVIGGVYADGALIEGEAGFSNGDMAEPGVTVEVFDANGDKLGETVTEEGGIFTFTAKRRTEHRFHANLGAGHVLDISLPAEELPAELSADDSGTTRQAPSGDSGKEQASTTPAIVGDGQLDRLVRKAVAAQVTPLRRELAIYHARATWHDVLGGLGYIFGLFGIAAWVQSRRREKGN